MKVINVTEDFIVRVYNNYDKSVVKVYYSDVLNNNGIYDFEWRNVTKIVKFNYKVIGSDKSSCPNEELFVGYLTTPKYNSFADKGICEGLSDYKYCSRFITFDISSSEQYNKIEAYRKEKEEKEELSKRSFMKKVADFVSEHKTLVIIGTIGIIAGGAGLVIIRNNRRRVK